MGIMNAIRVKKYSYILYIGDRRSDEYISSCIDTVVVYPWEEDRGLSQEELKSKAKIYIDEKYDDLEEKGELDKYGHEWGDDVKPLFDVEKDSF